MQIYILSFTRTYLSNQSVCVCGGVWVWNILSTFIKSYITDELKQCIHTIRTNCNSCILMYSPNTATCCISAVFQAPPSCGWTPGSSVCVLVWICLSRSLQQGQVSAFTLSKHTPTCTYGLIHTAECHTASAATHHSTSTLLAQSLTDTP